MIETNTSIRTRDAYRNGRIERAKAFAHFMNRLLGR